MKGREREGGRCTNVVIVRYFVVHILARNLRLVLELFMNCVCISDTTVLLYQLFSPLYSSQSKTHQAAHHSIWLLLLPPSSLSPPFQSLEENDVCYQPQSCRFETPATRSSVTFWPPLELEATSTRSNSSIALISCYFIHIIISEYIISMWLYFNCLVWNLYF